MVWDGQERRRYVRAVIPCHIVITPPSELPVIASCTLVSHTENIGEGGVRIVLEEELQTLTKIDLVLLIGKEKTIECKGKVVWVEKKGYSIKEKSLLKVEPLLFSIGIEFTEIDDSAKQYIRELIKTILAQKNE